MRDKQKPNYGTWVSKISSDIIASDSIFIDEARQSANAIYYIERRPAEKGRCVIIQKTNNTTIELLPKPYSARSRVHEYGGGCYCVANEIIYFVNDTDQDIYSVANKTITRITNDHSRYADLVYDKKFNRLICVCETHTNNDVINTIVSITIKTGKTTTLAAGNDFYASPKINSSSSQIFWQTWNLPNMPWDGNELWLAQLDVTGSLCNEEHIAGNGSTSIFQPEWSPDDTLFYISDDSGWWHLYHHNGIDNEQLTFGEKEFGLPQWSFSQSTYAFIDKKNIICCYQQNSIKTLALLSIDKERTLTDISTSWQEISSISAFKVNFCFIAASSLEFSQLLSANLNIEKAEITSKLIKPTFQLPLQKNWYSQAELITFKNRHDQTVFANYYAPKNPNHEINKTTPPPLIVISHGGPTGQSNVSLDPRKQYWTSRGFAILDVNYSGSTGYGKNYRLRLNNQWGMLDVDDCCDAALHAVKEGLANKNQLIIRGSSAGGFTVLSALTFRDIFSAGASYYGISDLTTLANDTHKFESRYLDNLVGPYPERQSTYKERSPINSADQLNCPVIFFQGIEDKVVPKEQAEMMFKLLSGKGLTVAAQYFAGEQHGFRKAETITYSLENELNFYKMIFQLTPESEVEFKGEITINNRR